MPTQLGRRGVPLAAHAAACGLPPPEVLGGWPLLCWAVQAAQLLAQPWRRWGRPLAAAEPPHSSLAPASGSGGAPSLQPHAEPARQQVRHRWAGSVLAVLLPPRCARGQHTSPPPLPRVGGSTVPYPPPDHACSSCRPPLLDGIAALVLVPLRARRKGGGVDIYVYIRRLLALCTCGPGLHGGQRQGGVSSLSVLLASRARVLCATWHPAAGTSPPDRHPLRPPHAMLDPEMLSTPPFPSPLEPTTSDSTTLQQHTASRVLSDPRPPPHALNPRQDLRLDHCSVPPLLLPTHPTPPTTHLILDHRLAEDGAVHELGTGRQPRGHATATRGGVSHGSALGDAARAHLPRGVGLCRGGVGCGVGRSAPYGGVISLVGYL